MALEVYPERRPGQAIDALAGTGRFAAYVPRGLRLSLLGQRRLLAAVARHGRDLEGVAQAELERRIRPLRRALRADRTALEPAAHTGIVRRENVRPVGEQRIVQA